MCGSQQGSLDEERPQPCCRASFLIHLTRLSSGYLLASLWPHLSPAFFESTSVLMAIPTPRPVVSISD